MKTHYKKRIAWLLILIMIVSSFSFANPTQGSESTPDLDLTEESGGQNLFEIVIKDSSGSIIQQPMVEMITSDGPLYWDLVEGVYKVIDGENGTYALMVNNLLGTDAMAKPFTFSILDHVAYGADGQVLSGTLEVLTSPGVLVGIAYGIDGTPLDGHFINIDQTTGTLAKDYFGGFLTKSDGSIYLPAVDGDYLLELSNGVYGYASDHKQYTISGGTALDTMDMQVVPAQFYGGVTDTYGQPLFDYVVVAFDDNNELYGAEYIIDSNHNKTYHFSSMAEGKYYLEAQPLGELAAMGYVKSDRQEVYVTQGSSLEVNLQLKKQDPGTVLLTIDCLDSNAQPLTQVRPSLSYQSIGGDLDYTQVDNQLLITQAQDGDYAITISSYNMGEATSAPLRFSVSEGRFFFRPDAGGQAMPDRYTMQTRQGIYAGKALDQSGQPATMAHLTMRTWIGDQYHWNGSMNIDPDGSFYLPSDAGDYLVALDDYQTNTFKDDEVYVVNNGQVTNPRDLQLKTTQLTGRLYNSDGTNALGSKDQYKLEFASPVGPQAFYLVDYDNGGLVYKLAGFDAGQVTYRIVKFNHKGEQLATSEWMDAIVVVNEINQIDMHLGDEINPGVILTVKGFDSLGNPLTDIMAVPLYLGSEGHGTQSGTSGNRFELHHATDGDYGIVISPKNEREAYSDMYIFKVVNGQAFDTSGQIISSVVNLNTRPGLEVGQVIHEDLSPASVGNLTIFEQDDSGNLVRVTDTQVRPDSKIIFPLIDNTYHVVLTEPYGSDLIGDAMTYTLEQGQVINPKNLVLTPVQLKGTLKGSSGEPLYMYNIQVKAVAHDGTTYKASTKYHDDHLVYRFGKLPLGDYTIETTLPENLLTEGYVKPSAFSFTVTNNQGPTPVTDVTIEKQDLPPPMVTFTFKNIEGQVIKLDGSISYDDAVVVEMDQVEGIAKVISAPDGRHTLRFNKFADDYQTLTITEEITFDVNQGSVVFMGSDVTEQVIEVLAQTYPLQVCVEPVTHDGGQLPLDTHTRVLNQEGMELYANPSYFIDGKHYYYQFEPGTYTVQVISGAYPYANSVGYTFVVNESGLPLGEVFKTLTLLKPSVSGQVKVLGQEVNLKDLVYGVQLVVNNDFESDGMYARVDDEGRFGFANIPAGDHSLYVMLYDQNYITHQIVEITYDGVSEIHDLVLNIQSVYDMVQEALLAVKLDDLAGFKPETKATYLATVEEAQKLPQNTQAMVAYDIRRRLHEAFNALEVIAPSVKPQVIHPTKNPVTVEVELGFEPSSLLYGIYVREVGTEDWVSTEGTFEINENGDFEIMTTYQENNVYFESAVTRFTIANIDKTLPQGTIIYSTTELTNQNVVATLVVDEDYVLIDGSEASHVFTQNGSYTFKFKDLADNAVALTAVVENIDKTAPVGTLTYSTTDLTNQDVGVTLSVNEAYTMVVGSETYTFTENGKHTFKFKDLAGNAVELVASVDYIDKTAPVGTLSYSTTDPTNQDVVVSLSVNEDYTMVEGSEEYTFTENGTHTFKFKDLAGNLGEVTATVDFIDKEAPVGEVVYSTTQPTSGAVVASLSVNEDVQAGSESLHVFVENGTYTFTFTDLAGNQGQVVASVNNIDKARPVVESVKVTKNNAPVTLVTGNDVISIEVTATDALKVTGTVSLGQLIVDQVLIANYNEQTQKYTLKADITVPQKYNGTLPVTLTLKDAVGNKTQQVALEALTINNIKPVVQAKLVNKLVNGFVVDQEVNIQAVSQGNTLYFGFDQANVSRPIAELSQAVNANKEEGVLKTVYLQAENSLNVKSEVVAIAYKWDAIAPEAPQISYDGSTLTNAKTITVSAPVTQGTVKVIRGNETVFTGKAADFKVGVNLGLRNGVNTFSITHTDLAGNVSQASNLVVTCDREAPVMAVTLNEDGSIKITANENVTEASYVLDGGQAQVLTFVDKAASLEKIEGAGDHQLVITAKDEAGNTGFGRLSFTTVAAKVDAPKELSTGITMNQGSFTDEAQLTVRTFSVDAGQDKAFVGEAIDFELDGGVQVGENGVVVTLSLGSGLPANTKLNYYDTSTNTWLPLDADLENGDSFYNASNEVKYVKIDASKAKAIEEGVQADGTLAVQPGDLIGLLRHFSGYAAIQDITAPTLTIDNQEASGPVQADTLNLTYTVSEKATVVVKNNGLEVTSNTVEAGTYVVEVALSEGDNVITAIATDLADLSSPEQVYTLVKDSSFEGLTTSISGQLKDQVVTRTDATSGDQLVVTQVGLNLVVTAVDANFDSITVNGVEYTSASVDTTLTLTEGTNTVQIIAKDAAQNSLSKVYDVVLDSQGPSIEVVGLAEGDVLTSDISASINLEANATFTATLKKNGVEVKTFANEAIAYTVDQNAKDVYSLAVIAADQYGNQSFKTLDFVVDTAAPAISAASVQAVSNQSQTASFTVTPKDAAVVITVRKDNQVVPGLTFATSEEGDAKTYALDFTTSGVYKVVVDAVKGSNASRKTLEFTIDKVAPVVTVSGVTNGATYTQQPTITFTSTDAVSATLNGLAIGSGYTTTANNDYSLVVISTDLAGNVTSQTINFKVNVQQTSVPVGPVGPIGGNPGGGGAPIALLPVDQVPLSGGIKFDAGSPVVSFKDTGIILDFSKATIDEGTEIMASVAEEVTLPVNTDKRLVLKVASKVYELEVSKAFKGQVEIKLPYDASLVKDTNKLVAAYYDEAKKAWVIMGGKVDLVNKVVIFRTSHFSKYAVLERSRNFDDMTNFAWAENAVGILAARGVVNGYSGNVEFRPGNEITRAEFATLIVNALNLTKGNKQVTFTDIKGQWYEDIMLTAASNGILSGYDGKAMPNDAITREQMAVMIMNAYKLVMGTSGSTETLTFDDASDVSSWATSAVAKAKKLGVINGKGNNTFAPKDQAKRAEAAMMIYNLLKALEYVK